MTSPDLLMPSLTDLANGWLAALHEELEGAVALRRRLHADPRLSGNEGDTASVVEDHLGIGLDHVAGTGRIGRVGPAAGPAVMIRAELDALPVSEATGAAFASPGNLMHACGHDVHLAALVAVVRASARIRLPVGLVPLLQPREETYPSGALDVLRSGALQSLEVAAAVGAHVHPGVPEGQVTTGAGVVNAAADEIEILVHGVGGHGAYPHEAVDPIAAVAHIVLALPELLRRTVPPLHPATISVGHLQAGEPSANVLPSSARVLATLRTTDSRDRERVKEQVGLMATRQAAAFGLVSEVDITSGEPVLYNDPALVERMDEWLIHGGFIPAVPMRSLGADDFSFFGDVVPSVMSFVGVRVAGHPDPPPLHHAEFLPTDDAVADVARTLVAGYLGAAQLVLEGKA